MGKHKRVNSTRPLVKHNSLAKCAYGNIKSKYENQCAKCSTKAFMDAFNKMIDDED